MTIFKKSIQLVSIVALAASACMSFADAHNNPYQRYIILHNDLPFTIYPVVQVPDNNCHDGSKKVNRIMVNQDTGLQKGQTVKVNIPDKCWYNAGRIYLSTVPIAAFEQLLDATQRTTPTNVNHLAPLCVSAVASGSQDNAVPMNCSTGVADASYPLDSPAQLVEYTFDADDPKTGKAETDPDKGIPMADIDISYVDQAYLPVAIAVDDNGASGYLGTAIAYEAFKQKTSDFIRAGWSSFAAFSAKNWNNNLFHSLIAADSPIQGGENIPAGYNLFELIITKATSVLYKTPPPKMPLPLKGAQCANWDGCAHLSGDCCPVNGVFLACCGIKEPTTINFMIDKTEISDNKITNPTFDLMASRWKMWVDTANDPCADIDKITTWPSNNSAFDKKSFCDQFSKTAKFVWDYFSKTATHCGDNIDKDHCIIETILGYNSQVLGGQLPESVQALLRSVPYVPEGSGPQYQYDKWLLFWAPFDSIFNLDPFTHYIHRDINAVAYSFSIDDKYGNFRTKGSGFIVDAGGDTALVNKSIFDPYEQYFVSWSKNWDHATVCGNPVAINSLPGNARVSFWQKGVKQDSCLIVLYAASGDHVDFLLGEQTAQVTDNYTGISGYSVQGLTNDTDYCIKNSSPKLNSVCADSNLSYVAKGDIAYMNVGEGRPNVYLNIPQPPESAVPTTDKPVCSGRRDDKGQIIPCCNPSLKQICPGQIDCPLCDTDNCECPAATPTTQNNNGFKACSGALDIQGRIIPCCNPSLNQTCPDGSACPSCGTNDCECPPGTLKP